MEIAYLFIHLDINDPPNFTASQYLPDFPVKRCIAEHMADHDGPFGLIGAPQKGIGFLLIYGKGLFQKHIVAFFEQWDRCCHMQTVHGAVNHGIRKFGDSGKLFHRPEAMAVGNMKKLLRRMYPFLIDVNNAGDGKKLRMR